MAWKPVEVDQYDVVVPLYYQVQRMILDHVFENVQPGEKLPTEKELCATFKVSRSTMRQALDLLVREGYIERFKGRGTFLKRKPALVERIRSRAAVPTIAFAVPGTHSPGVVAKAVQILDSTALKEGYLLTYTNLNHDLPVLEEHLRGTLRAGGIAGVVYFPLVEPTESGSKNERILGLFRSMSVPFVVIDRLPVAADRLSAASLAEVIALSTSVDYDWVMPDNLQGGATATRHLALHGHRRIAFVGAALSHASFLREHGYRRALREAAGAEALVVRDSTLLSSEPRAKELVLELVASGATAVVCEFDLLARELLRACEAAGVEVPAALSIVGYDDLDFCRYLRVPLTTMRQPVETEIQMAVDILFQKIRSSSTTLRHVQLPVELVERQSTAGAPASSR